MRDAWRQTIYADDDELTPVAYIAACAAGCAVGAVFYLVRWARDRLLTAVVQ